MLLLLVVPFLARMSLGCTTWKKGPCLIPYRVDGTLHTECLNREVFLNFYLCIFCLLFLNREVPDEITGKPKVRFCLAQFVTRINFL